MGSPTSRIDAQAEVPDQAFGDRVIDLNSHVNPLEDELLSYVEDDVVRDKLTTEFGSISIMGKWDAAYGIKESNEGLFTQGRAEYAEDAHEACEKFAIDDPIANAGINNLLPQYHPALKNGIVQMGNDYMLDNFADEGAYASMLVPKWDTEYVIEEIECVASEDNIIAAYSWFDPKTPQGSEQLEPVFEILVEHDPPLLLYGLLAYWPQYSYVGDEMLTWTEALGFDWPVHTMVNIANMVTRGVFDQYPDLDVVFQEGGHWWLPFLRYRMDEFYGMHPDDIRIIPQKRKDGKEYLDQRPSEYLRDNIYVTAQPLALPRGSGQARDLLELSVVEDTFIYSSDQLHQTLDPPTWFYTFRAFDEDLRDAVLHRNAENILGI